MLEHLGDPMTGTEVGAGPVLPRMPKAANAEVERSPTARRRK